MKNITIAGRLTKDAENRTAGSDNVTGFSVAVDDRQGKEKGTLYFDCNLWGKRGESLSPHLIRGSSVTVSGDLSTRIPRDGEMIAAMEAEVTAFLAELDARIEDLNTRYGAQMKAVA